MSLTSLVDSREGRAVFQKHVRRPQTKPSAPVRVPALATPPNWTGQAFDYALRFGLAARWPGAHRRETTLADRAVERVERALGSLHRVSQRVRERRDGGLAALQALEGDLTREQAGGCFDLGLLEVFGRGGDPLRFASELDRVVTTDHIDELLALWALVQWDPFTPSRLAALNPTFRDGSRLVGGADADVLVDDLLVEIKVVRESKLDIAYVRQLVGYAVLANEFGIDGVGRVEVERLGVWFARSSELVSWRLDECTSPEGREALLHFLGRNGEKG